MDSVQKDKFKVGLLLSAAILNILAVALWMFFVDFVETNSFQTWIFILLFATSIAMIFRAFQYWKKDIKAGIPLHDERTKRIIERASARAFIFMIYWLLAIGWFADSLLEGIIPRHATTLGLVGGIVFFMGAWAYYNWRGVSA